jgi:hypothetical protein
LLTSTFPYWLHLFSAGVHVVILSWAFLVDTINLGFRYAHN